MNGEIRNGITGFIDSVMTGFYQFILVAKVIEAKIKSKQRGTGINETIL